MNESDFQLVTEIFAQSADSRVQRWDGQTLTEALVWCSHLQRPHSLLPIQRQLCHQLSIDLTDTKKCLLARLMDNPFCSGELMTAIIRSFPNPNAFSDAFAAISCLEARSELFVREHDYLNGEICRLKALACSIHQQLRETCTASIRASLIEQLCRQSDTMKALFWTFADIVENASHTQLHLSKDVRQALVNATIDYGDFEQFFMRSCMMSESFERHCFPICLARITSRIESRDFYRRETQDDVRFLRQFIMEHDTKYRQQLQSQIETDAGLSESDRNLIISELFIKNV